MPWRLEGGIKVFDIEVGLSEAELQAMVRLNPVPPDEVRQRMPVPSPPASPHKH